MGYIIDHASRLCLIMVNRVVRQTDEGRVLWRLNGEKLDERVSLTVNWM